MVNIDITQEHKEFVLKYAPNQDIGGFSNLSKSDLSKSSRLGFQYTGIYGELAWYLYRYNSLDKLKDLLEFKFQNLRPINKGDDGFDDSVTHNSKTRFIDVKTSHVSDELQIPRLNLVVPKREYHENMIYITAFTVGNDKSNRLDIDKVILAGWVANEHITEKWSVDPSKYAVKVKDLKNLDSLKKIL